MVDDKFTLEDYQNLLLTRKQLKFIRANKQTLVDPNYQNALQMEKRLEDKLEFKGVTPELQEVIDAAVAVQQAQAAMGDKIKIYAAKYDGKPDFPSGGEQINEEPKKIIKE